MKNKFRGMILAFGILILFVVSAMTPIIGYDVRTIDENMKNEKYDFVGCPPYELSNHDYNSEAVDLSKETAEPVLIEKEVSSPTTTSDGCIDSKSKIISDLTIFNSYIATELIHPNCIMSIQTQSAVENRNGI